MTKSEAKAALAKGKIVSHLYFTSSEYIYMKDGKLMDENGNTLNWMEFWKYKQTVAFDKGWRVLKVFVLTVSKVFPCYHPSKRQPTDFEHKIKQGLKIHTIRNNFEHWAAIARKVNSGEAIVSVRKWTSVPYQSTQIEFMKINKIGIEPIYIENRSMGISVDDAKEGFRTICLVFDKPTDISLIAKNDGLTTQELLDWFKINPDKPSGFSGAIIHFTKFRYV